MSFKYKLPGENLQVMECETESNALVIIGANGFGKSKLGGENKRVFRCCPEGRRGFQE